MRALKEELDAARAAQAENDGALAENRQALADAESALAETENALADAQTALENAESALTETEGSAEQRRVALAEARSRLAAAESRLAQRDRDMERLASELAAATKAQQEAEAALAEAETARRAAEQVASGNAPEGDADAAAETQALRSQMTTLEQERDAAQAELAGLRAALEAMEARLEALRFQNAALDEALAALNAERGAQNAPSEDTNEERSEIGALVTQGDGADGNEAGDAATTLADTSGGAGEEEAPEQAPMPARHPERRDSQFKDCSDCPEMATLTGGVFRMGARDDESGGQPEERPTRLVTIRRFAIGVDEVRFEEWDACVADGFCRAIPPGGEDDAGTDRGWGRGDRPVIGVSWGDTQDFIRWLNSKVEGAPYRLPSEAEWEFAARGGSERDFHLGDQITAQDASFNPSFSYNGSPTAEFIARTRTVRSFAPNAYGLYDMHGNVWEWVADCWHESYDGAPAGGQPWLEANDGNCDKAVVRGGSWVNSPNFLRSAARDSRQRETRNRNLGFRVVRDL